MTLIATLLIALFLVLMAVIVLIMSTNTGRSGLETQWDDPLPEQYLGAWAAHQNVSPVTPA